MRTIRKVHEAALYTEGLLMCVKSRRARVRILESTRESAVRELCRMNGRDYYRPDRDEIHRELAAMYDSFGK